MKSVTVLEIFFARCIFGFAICTIVSLFRSELKKTGKSLTSLTLSGKTVFTGLKFIGPPGFEPGTSSTPRKRATRLRYGPYELEIISTFSAARKPELPPGCSSPRTHPSSPLKQNIPSRHGRHVLKGK